MLLRINLSVILKGENKYQDIINIFAILILPIGKGAERKGAKAYFQVCMKNKSSDVYNLRHGIFKTSSIMSRQIAYEFLLSLLAVKHKTNVFASSSYEHIM